MLFYCLDYPQALSSQKSLSSQKDMALNILQHFNTQNVSDSLTGARLAQFEHHHFPDGESYFRLLDDVKNQDAVIVCQLHQPNEKIPDLLFLSETLKQAGAKSIGLVAPYLSYMRQDKKFHDGECITSRHFSAWINQRFDWLVTIDPHLHRYHHLNEIYSIPSRALHATGIIADYVRNNIASPILIGPDSESEQWVNAVAEKANCPALVLSKIRKGDRDVEISIPEIEQYAQHQAVLIDDIISTGKTMLGAAHHIKQLTGKKALCIGVHAVFAPGALEEMHNADIEDVLTCNCIHHSSNALDVSLLLAQGIDDIFSNRSES